MRNGQVRLSSLFNLGPLLVFLGLMLVFFAKLAFSNLILARGDTFLYFYPYWQAASTALRAGRVPLWNTEIFMGSPLLANSQMGFFYPLNWPVWLFFSPPNAVKASILFHILIAGIGTYMSSRRVTGVGRFAALLAAGSFALGGYLTAQVEHVNQLQGLAWLPWFLVALSIGEKPKRSYRLGSLMLLAVLFALQLLAGHMQTAFISGIGLIIWTLAAAIWRWMGKADQEIEPRGDIRNSLVIFLIIASAVFFALIIAAIQVLPTLELTQYSSRQAGLSVHEVLSFSLHPLLLGRALLPAFNQSLFSEYVAYLPLIFLALAFIAARQWRRIEGVFPALVWAIFGLLMAFGVFNPLNWLIARIPGFNLFRVPARWMVLYALGVSLLMGVGWQFISLQIKLANETPDKIRSLNLVIRPLLIFGFAALLLIGWDFTGRFLVPFIPTGSEAPYEPPAATTILLWLAEFFILGLILLLLLSNKWKPLWKWLAGLLAISGIGVLYIGSRTLPYNNLTTPEAFFDLRPSITRLKTETSGDITRFLSLSEIFFDSGDQGEIDSIYEDQLSLKAQYDYTIAIKEKEVIVPNLSMVYGLSAVDGFDGGVLPIRAFSQIMTLVLPDGIETTDGRLREQLETIPNEKWLDLFNARYIITDKVGDLWQNGIFFDRQHATTLKKGEGVPIGYLPEYEATGLQILASNDLGLAKITTINDDQWELKPIKINDGLFAVTFPEPTVLKELWISACPGADECVVEAITLVDERDGTFQSVVPGAYKMIHSGDVKIYENLNVSPRAFWVHDWRWAADEEESLKSMRAQDFDPQRTAVIIKSDSMAAGIAPSLDNPVNASAQIITYLPEKVVISAESQVDGLLILTDSYYPSWQATVDGQEKTIEQVDGLFRGVFVPAGQHEVVFELSSQSYNYGRALSLVGLVILAILLIFSVRLKTRLDA